MAYTSNKDAQFRDKPSMPWFDVPELQVQWTVAICAADRTALDAGAFAADLAIAHMNAAKDLMGWTNEQFADFLMIEPDHD